MSSNFQYNAYKEQVELSKGQINKLQERVQELEEKNIQLEKDIKEWGIVNECWEEINTRLIEQNKHYREALETIEMVTVFKSEANEIANKVLEGDLE